MQSCSSYTSHITPSILKGIFIEAFKKETMEEKKIIRLTETVQSAG